MYMYTERERDVYIVSVYTYIHILYRCNFIVITIVIIIIIGRREFLELVRRRKNKLIQEKAEKVKEVSLRVYI